MYDIDMHNNEPDIIKICPEEILLCLAVFYEQTHVSADRKLHK